MRRALFAALGAATVLVTPMHASAQRDTIRYGELLSQAVSADPRQRQLRLQEAATELRLRNIAADRLPSLALDGQAQYQSAVTTIPIAVPGISIPTPPHDTYDAHLGAEAPLLDPTFASRREVERARLAESQAQVRTTLFALRQEVTDAFFTAAGLQERMSETDAAIAELSARLREMVVRFREGAALRGDTAAIAATLDERRQDRLALAADRGAALARLALLTGRPIAGDAVLVAPATAALAVETSRGLDSVRSRPEFEQFAATRQRLEEQTRLATA
ncbi:MAG TPA: TolC family protein, partial [Gemmatimonadaceae bacterium]|nr:TolC family protein [Gemmatimonadaceae bacterium]